MMDETQYRQKIQETFDRIDRALENEDPDLLECDQQFGALTIQFGNGARTILSAQPSVRQLWLALASQGRALHFNWDAEKSVWMDDKGQGIELYAFLEGFLRDSIQKPISLA